MTTTKDICKVCGAPMNSAICHQCGWTPMLFPARVPKSIHDFESERIAVAKEIMKEKEMHISQEKALQENQQNLISVSSQLSEAKDKLKQNEKVLESAYAKSEEDKHRIAELEKKLADAQQYTKSTEANTALAYLVMTSRDKVSAIYEIHEGENSFGYSNSHGNHHQIICDQPIADKHFVIKAKTALSQRGIKRTEFTVKPCEGKLFGAKGEANRYNAEVVLEKNSSIYIGDIRFTLVANKQ